MNTFGARSQLKLGETAYQYYSLEAHEKQVPGVSRLPFSLKVMVENLLRHEDNETVWAEDVRAVVDAAGKKSDREIAFRPARVLMQDFTGVPAVVDLATMRDVVERMGGRPDQINPLQPVDLVIDHSVQVDQFGTPTAFAFKAQI
jgi:aconitate hydratase